MHNPLRRLTAFLAAAVSLLTASGCQGSGDPQPESSEIPQVNTVLTVTAFNVGKADAMVIQTDNSVTVIDAGNKGDGKVIEKYLTNQGIETVNNFIITHFDKDHVGGAARLVNRMKIENVYVPDYTSESDEYTSFIEKIDETGTPLHVMTAKSSENWSVDEADFRLYAPNETDYGKNEENDFSLVLYVTHGQNSLLFTGDAENARMDEIIALNLGKVDFLKFPYHGNYLTKTEAFLDACDPSYTVVCCSEKEYADDYTVETLKKRGIKTYYTCAGTVTAVSNGQTISCTQNTADAGK